MALALGLAAAAPGALATAGPAAAGTAPVGVAAGTGPIGGAALASRSVVLAAGAPALPRKLTAASFVVADLDSGQVLAARNPHGRFAPASTLKVLTAITLLPRLPAGRAVRVTEAEERVDGTKVGLVPGQRVTVRMLFTALLVVSANDAANVLADAAGGTPATLARMREQARRLQAADTVPKTVHGLDAPGQTSSAYDLALLGRAGLALPAFRQYVAIRRAQMPAPHGTYQIATHDRLLGTYPGLLGGKNGFTRKALGSVVVAARRNGRAVIVAMMRTGPTMWPEASALLTWGFRADGKARPVGRLADPLPPGPPPGARVAAIAPARASGAGSSGGTAPGGGLGVPAVLGGAAALGGVLVLAVRRVARAGRAT